MNHRRTIKRVAVAIGGGLVLLAGIVMIVLPGPAFIVIPVGLGILAMEFEWAQRWLHWVKSKLPKKKRKAAPAGK